MTMETAKSAKEAQAGLDKKVNGCTTTVIDKTNGKSGVGHSEAIRAEIRAQNWEEQGYASKTAARKATKSGEPSHLQKTHSEVKPAVGRNTAQNSCAEHAAFDKYHSNNPDYSIDNTRTSTVYHNKHDNTYYTIKRCENCKAYGPNMGDVVTDRLPHRTPVPPENYVAAGSTIGATAKAGVGVLLQPGKGNKRCSKPATVGPNKQREIGQLEGEEALINGFELSGTLRSAN